MKPNDLVIYEHNTGNSVLYLPARVVSITPRQQRAAVVFDQTPVFDMSGLERRRSVLTRKLFVRFIPPRMGEPLQILDSEADNAA